MFLLGRRKGSASSEIRSGPRQLSARRSG